MTYENPYDPPQLVTYPPHSTPEQEAAQRMLKRYGATLRKFRDSIAEIQAKTQEDEELRMAMPMLLALPTALEAYNNGVVTAKALAHGNISPETATEHLGLFRDVIDVYIRMESTGSNPLQASSSNRESGSRMLKNLQEISGLLGEMTGKKRDKPLG